jgi:hypothetical protein
MKFLSLLVLLLCSLGSAYAQPSIHLVDSAKKSWMPDGKGTVGLRFRNVGNKPLIVTSGKITSSANVFNLITSFTAPKILAPGDTSYIIVEVNAQIAYEYFASIDLISNDPVRPVATFALRINDSIPPNPVRTLTATPQKNGELAINWQAPATSRDKDSIVFYRAFVIAKNGDYEDIYTGKGNSVTVKSKFENDVVVSVLSYDDMGNRSVSFDTTWADRTRPTAWITKIDEQFPGIPEHIERGNPHFNVGIRDWHMGSIDAYWREPGSSQLNLLSQASSFPLFTEEHKAGFSWNTSQLRGKKEIVLIVRDAVDNTDTIVYPLTVSQIKGWSKGMVNHPVASSVTIAKDEGGRFVMTGGDIASGIFRPNGHHYYYNWPLDITRSTKDRVITAAVDLDRDDLSEIVTLNQDNKLMILDHHGMIENEFGSANSTDRYASVMQNGDSTFLLIGASPIAVRDPESGSYLTFGASGSWYATGASAGLNAALAIDGSRERDRFVVANLLSKTQEDVVRVHDNGVWEELSIHNATGSTELGPIQVWKPNGDYAGFYPSIGDIDGDNALDIVLPAANDSLYAYHHDGRLVSGYPIHLLTSTSGRNQAMLADLDRDGASDIILSLQDSIVAISGKSGVMIRSDIWPIRRTAAGTSFITIADLNSDGYLELIESPSATDTSWVYAYDLDVRNEPGAIEWGTFQHDMQRSGNYNTPSRELQSKVSVKQTKAGYQLIGKRLHLSALGNVKVLDILGREVLAMTVAADESIDLSKLPSGVYMVDIDELEVIKIIL